MMQYNKTELEQEFLVSEGHSLKKAGFIDESQFRIIDKKLTVLKSQKNILIRIGFFLLGSFLYSSICGFLTLISLDSMNENYQFLVYLFAIIGFIGAEVLTNQKYYGYGLDDAFLLGAQLCLAIAIGISTEGNEITISLILSVTSLLCYLRYVQLSMAILFCVTLTCSILFLMFELGAFAKTILPFTMMFFTIAIYFSSKKLLAKLTLPFYYNGIIFTQAFALILFYISGNYMVVRELSRELMGVIVTANNDIPFAIFFYGFTFIVPVSYLVLSLFKKDRFMLWIGILALCFSIYTIRFYYAVLSVEIALTIGGLILFAFTFFAIKKIKNNTNGVTFQPDRFSQGNLFGTAEILMATQLGLKPETTVESPMEFGGGDFSGGGSGGIY
ncbi:hypothetical protein FVB9288_01294 [Flavobacterium sp. CECT 9288]|uniref:hypothetical protein n=1 Tax=Flavobacterium sp. CECT 9288 TaxID=2845819 RepID=UPI001E52C4B4|nr:hypothetical protein [Flavobacterium sp. CECT 9288]CAH0335646.1 hypothetical protein FVB9288_01294 [Flavobacterium sp. CECT 9288]